MGSADITSFLPKSDDGGAYPIAADRSQSSKVITHFDHGEIVW